MVTPWSPPGWMKTSGSMLGSNPDTKQPSSLLPEAYQPFANYIVKTVQGYQAAGVPIYALSNAKRAALCAAHLQRNADAGQ